MSENDFILKEAFSKEGVEAKDGLQYWIGANDISQEGRWVWFSDSTFFFDQNKHVSINELYQNWGSTTLGTQPNNVLKNEEDEDCTVIRADGFWYDIGCGKRYSYVICECSK